MAAKKSKKQKQKKQLVEIETEHSIGIFDRLISEDVQDHYQAIEEISKADFNAVSKEIYKKICFSIGGEFEEVEKSTEQDYLKLLADIRIGSISEDEKIKNFEELIRVINRLCTTMSSEIHKRKSQIILFLRNTFEDLFQKFTVLTKIPVSEIRYSAMHLIVDLLEEILKFETFNTDSIFKHQIIDFMKVFVPQSLFELNRKLQERAIEFYFSIIDKAVFFDEFIDSEKIGFLSFVLSSLNKSDSWLKGQLISILDEILKSKSINSSKFLKELSR